MLKLDRNRIVGLERRPLSPHTARSSHEKQEQHEQSAAALVPLYSVVLMVCSLVISASTLQAPGSCDGSSDVWKQIEILIIFVCAALTFSDQLFRFDKLDALDPLHHLVTELIFHAQAKGRAIYLGESAVIHLERQNTLRFEKVFDKLRVVIDAAEERGPERKESSNAGRRQRSNEFDDGAHGDAARFRNACPALNTVMHRDVVTFAEALQV